MLAALPSEEPTLYRDGVVAHPKPEVQSKHQLQGEPGLPFAAGSRPSSSEVQRRGDNTELTGVRDIYSRIIVMRRVRRAEHLRPEL